MTSKQFPHLLQQAVEGKTSKCNGRFCLLGISLSDPLLKNSVRFFSQTDKFSGGGGEVKTGGGEGRGW